MEINLVQSAVKVVVGGNADLAFPSAVKKGNVICVTQASHRRGGNTIQTPTDTLRHVYKPMTAQHGSAINTALRSFFTEVTTGGSNTVNFKMDSPASGEISVTGAEFSGVGGFDKGIVLKGGVGLTSSISINPSQSASLLYAAMICSQNNVGAKPSWNLLQEVVRPNTLSVFTQWKVGTASEERASWKAEDTLNWAAHVAVFKPGLVVEPEGPSDLDRALVIADRIIAKELFSPEEALLLATQYVKLYERQ